MGVREGTSEALRPPKAPRWWINRLAAPLVALASLLGFVVSARNCPGEHNRHVVASRVREWEQAIRAHSPDSRLFIEDNDVQGEDAVAREARHQAFADFERLGQIDDFRIADIVVNVDGDKALASYRIRGGAHLKGERIPHGGELQFMLWRGRWQIVGHRLVE